MDRLPILDELPQGQYRCASQAQGHLALHVDWADRLREAGYGLGQDPALETSDLAGRKPLFELPMGEVSLLQRRYTHGGLLRWATGRRFKDPTRPFREILLREHLIELGVSSPRIVAARAQSSGRFWSLDVLSVRLPDTLDLGYVLAMARRGELESRQRGAWMQTLGALIRRLHAGGFLHADLQPNNLLVDRSALTSDAEPVIHVIDLDRSTLHSELSDEQRLRNLRRLYRHIERRRREEGTALTRCDLRRFWKGYDPEGRRWKREWSQLAEGASSPGSLHRVGWFLERHLGRGRDARARD